MSNITWDVAGPIINVLLGICLVLVGIVHKGMEVQIEKNKKDADEKYAKLEDKVEKLRAVEFAQLNEKFTEMLDRITQLNVNIATNFATKEDFREFRRENGR